MVAEYVCNAKPDKGSSREPAPHSCAGTPASRSATPACATPSRSGSQYLGDVSVPSSTPDQPAIAVTDGGEATVIVDVCPDEDGTVVATATTSATVDAAGNGLSYRVVADADDRALATVNGQAEVASVAHARSWAATRPGAGSVLGRRGRGCRVAPRGHRRVDRGRLGRRDPPTSVEVVTAEGGNEADIRAWALTRARGGAHRQGHQAASRVWRGGRCLELKCRTAGQDRGAGLADRDQGHDRQKAYDDEVEREVTATSGRQGGRAARGALMAPATFTSTATSQPEGEGKVTFKSVSNRGIAGAHRDTGWSRGCGSTSTGRDVRAGWSLGEGQADRTWPRRPHRPR